jgi:arabinogalactan oligomer/maltooligosaccharide transport system permease protein
MIIIYFILKLIHLETNIYSLILINVAGSAMSYYIAKGFFDTVPKSLDEAAMIDGANKNTIFFRVIMPLSKPIVVYTLLLSFTGPWGDFMMASYLSLGRNNSMTVAVGLQQMLSLAEKQTYFGVFCAGGVLVAVPIMILFFWLQRYYVEGITGGAVKG